MPKADLLRLLWPYLEERDVCITDRSLPYWPEGALERLTELKLLQRIDDATMVACDSCDERTVGDVYFAEATATHPAEAYMLCPECGRVHVPYERLYQWTVDIKRLLQLLAEALGLKGNIEELAADRIWLLGRRTLAGKPREFFFARVVTRPGIGEVAQRCPKLQSSNAPVVLVPDRLPTSPCWGAATPKVVSLMALAVLEEDQAIEVDWEYLESQVDDGSQRKTIKAKEMSKFPTPPGSHWNELQIKFRDGHTISATIRTETKVYHYAQMGMANSKNGNPTLQWQLLGAFAEGHGVLDWQSRHADTRNQKRREVLAKNLMAFFGIDSDPFRLTSDGKGWEAIFKVQPER